MARPTRKLLQRPRNYVYELSPWQDECVSSIKRETCFDGGVGALKTTACLIRLLVLADAFPGSRWFAFRETFKDLESTMRNTWREKVCPPSYISRSVQESDTLNNGSEIIWAHLDEYGDSGLRGLEINGAVGSQIEECAPEKWEILDSRIGRWQLEGWPNPCPAYIWGDCNPEGHDWVYYRFHPDIIGLEHPDRKYIFCDTLMARPWLDKVNPGYVDNLLKKPEDWKRKWVFGSRQVFEGMIHKEFSLKVHRYDSKVFDPFKARKIRNVWGYYDHGQSSPSCLLLFARDADGFSYCFFEYYADYKTPADHAKAVHKAMQECEAQTKHRVEGIYADPSIFFETKDPLTKKIIRPSIAREYQEAGIYFLAADNNEELSIEKINSALQVKQELVNPVTGEMGSPKVFFSDVCTNTIEQIPQQRYKKRRNLLTGEQEFISERESQIPDHAYDPFRYWANSDTFYVPYTGTIRKPHYGVPVHA